MEIFLSDMSDGKATVASLEVCTGYGTHYEASGSSRKTKGDKYDPELGELIAYTRALDNLTTKMKLDMKKRIRELDKGE